jgi:hypothetical protein
MVLDVTIELSKVENGWVAERTTSKGRKRYIFNSIKEIEEWIGREADNSEKLKIIIKSME